jgi:uncharacterized membrane protein
MRPVLRLVYALTMLTTGLVAGVFFSEYLGLVPVLRGLPAGEYVRMKQAVIAAYNPAMPILGIGGSVFYVAWLVMLRKQRRSRTFLWGLAGFVLLMISTAVTMVGELPANAQVLAMAADHPAPNLDELRRTTVTVITVRTLLTLLSFACLVLSSSHSMKDEKTASQ